MKPTARLAPGFTLIEIMLAVAILALILVMLAGSFHAIATGKTQAEDRLALDESGRAILWQMANELRGAVLTPTIQSRVLLMGEGRVEDGRPLDSFAVSTLDPGHRRTLEDFGAEDTVSYTTAPNPAHRGWFLLLRSQSSSLLGIGVGGQARQPLIIADNLLSLHIRYFDGSGWAESWNSQSQPPAQQLPPEIALDLTLAGPRQPFSLSTIVTLPMAAYQW